MPSGTRLLPSHFLSNPNPEQAGVVHQQLRMVMSASHSAKFRKIFRNRIAHAEPSLLPQLHDRGGRHHDLGQRRAIKHGINRHRLGLRLNRAAAVGFAMYYFSVVPTMTTAPGFRVWAMASWMMRSRTTRRGSGEI